MSKGKQIDQKQVVQMARDICCKSDKPENCKDCDAMWCKAQLHAFRAHKAGYRKQSEWISVEERLPRYNETVLVYRPTMGEKILADTYKGYYNEDTGDWEEGWVKFGQNSIGMNVITHWMPLPEPPKGD